jgi:chromosome segregation ATPase
VKKKIELPKVDFPIREFKVPSLSKTLFGTNTIQEDLKAENGRLKRELEVREMAIKDLQEQNEDKQALIEKGKYLLEKEERNYLNTLSKLTHLDAELENKREQLRQAREEVVSLGKELEHLRPLMVLYMKEKVEG